ncbi:MAG TPA: DUF1385 domain-containing protein [Anaerolineaceae bacterium]|nr:DUF1385 domain-containing protein [Anaerolineaceae bacterium]
MSDKTDAELKLPSYGGQALIEGVLMRGSRYLAAAYRAPNDEIIVETEKLTGIYTSKIARIPFLRGLVILWDAIGLGTKYLTRSANIQTGEEEKIEGPAMALSLILSFSIAIALFFIAPAGLASLLEKWVKISPFVGNLIEGMVRLLLIIAYIWGIGRMKDIKRVFSYHGAEHKTINAFESSSDLDVPAVKKFSLYHPRCGTGFIVILVIFSIILFVLIGPIENVFLKLGSRVLLLPLLVMLAYEYMRFSANHSNHPIFRALSFINLSMQRLTTVEPDEKMVEVALKAFTTMYNLENEQA